jgi:AraC-like DNA-binding protein
MQIVPWHCQGRRMDFVCGHWGIGLKRFFVMPRIGLQPYVDRIWGWESEQPAVLPAMLPGTGAELMFHYASAVAIQSVRSGSSKVGRAFLLCSRRSPHQPLPQGRVGFVSVRMRSGALRHFCPLPLADLIDDAIAIEDIWGRSGKEVMDRVTQAAGTPQRIAIIEAWLQDRLAEHAKPEPAIEAAVHQLYYGHQNVKIDILAGQLGMSRRNFERVFQKHIGLAPKVFQRTARFHLTVRDMLLTASHDYLGVALDHGYYDQAHFIHEFEDFVGSPPVNYLGDTQRMAHFYNHPLFRPDKVPLPR